MHNTAEQTKAFIARVREEMARGDELFAELERVTANGRASVPTREITDLVESLESRSTPIEQPTALPIFGMRI